MPDPEQAFGKLLGRQPSEREMQSLYRVKDALGLKENDALWLVLVALESYDTLYRKYPEMVSAQVSKTAEEQRRLIAAIADAETKRALGTLADAVGKTSETVALRLVQAKWLQWCALASIGLVAFGSLCTFVGYVLGSGKMPWWALPSSERSFPELILSTIARTPAGWMAGIMAVGLSGAACWLARAQIGQSKRYDLIAGSLVIACLASVCLWPLL